MDTRIAGKKGGLTTKKRHGKKFYRENQKRAVESRLSKKEIDDHIRKVGVDVSIGPKAK